MCILTLLGWGGLNQPALFSNVHFSMKKGVWRSQISRLFLVHFELSKIKKKVFGWSRRCGPTPPHSQGRSRSPALLGLIYNLNIFNMIFIIFMLVFVIFHMMYKKIDFSWVKFAFGDKNQKYFRYNCLK